SSLTEWDCQAGQPDLRELLPCRGDMIGLVALLRPEDRRRIQLAERGGIGYIVPEAQRNSIPGHLQRRCIMRTSWRIDPKLTLAGMIAGLALVGGVARPTPAQNGLQKPAPLPAAPADTDKAEAPSPLTSSADEPKTALPLPAENKEASQT